MFIHSTLVLTREQELIVICVFNKLVNMGTLEGPMAIKQNIGFSTQEIQGRRGWTLTGIELIKRDLMNEFQTRKGERLMMPTFGTIIWDLLFEPFTDGTKAAIVDDVKRIVGHDTRVGLRTVNVSTSAHGIMVALDLDYKPYGSVGSFSLEFDRRSLERI
jgi:phage baseplate assembly protein W